MFNNQIIKFEHYNITVFFAQITQFIIKLELNCILVYLFSQMHILMIGIASCH